MSEGKLGAAFCVVRARGGRPLGFFSCMDGHSDKIRKKESLSLPVYHCQYLALYTCTSIQEKIIHIKIKNITYLLL